jgi:GAF domain-containing protein
MGAMPVHSLGSLRSLAAEGVRQRWPVRCGGRQVFEHRLRFALDGLHETKRVTIGSVGTEGENVTAEEREHWLIDALVMLADTLTAEFDTVEFLSTLTELIVELLDAAEVGLVITDSKQRLQVVASSTDRMHLIELFEVQTREGPCLDSYRDGTPVVNVDLRGADARWPVFTPMARSAGFRMVHALPMRWHDQLIGATNIFHSARVIISERDANLAQAFADVATIGLLHERAARGAENLSEQLQRALTARVQIEQAKGVVAERAGIEMDEAFGWLRKYSRGNHLRVADVARGVLDRTISLEQLQAALVSSGEIERGRSKGE